MNNSLFILSVGYLQMNKAIIDWQEIGWDSEKPGYDGLIDVAHRIMVGRSNSDATDAAVSTSVSLFLFAKIVSCIFMELQFHFILTMQTRLRTHSRTL